MILTLLPDGRKNLPSLSSETMRELFTWLETRKTSNELLRCVANGVLPPWACLEKVSELAGPVRWIHDDEINRVIVSNDIGIRNGHVMSGRLSISSKREVLELNEALCFRLY